MIKIQNVNHFFKKKQILKDFSLNINSNSVTSILGPSGSGKTTLLRLICGLENLQSGNIKIENNNNMPNSKFDDTMNNISFVFQDSALFPHLTVMENIYYGLSKLENSKVRIDSLIKDYNIDKMKFSYPHQLSGGQKQLVALLRALASNPKILLLDEPFAALDVLTIKILQKIIVDLQTIHNISIILCDHQARDLLNCVDRAIILSNGHIIASGSPNEVISDKDAKNQYFGDEFNIN